MEQDILTVIVQDGPQETAILTASGEIDRDSRADLRSAADEAIGRGVRRLVLDVGKVSFCDSSGLSLFIDLHRKTRRRDGWLRLVAVPPYMREMLRVTRLDELLDVADPEG